MYVCTLRTHARRSQDPPFFAIQFEFFSVPPPNIFPTALVMSSFSTLRLALGMPFAFLIPSALCDQVQPRTPHVHDPLRTAKFTLIRDVSNLSRAQGASKAKPRKKKVAPTLLRSPRIYF